MSLSSSGAAVPNPTLQRKLRRCTDPSADDAELMAALRSLSDASDEQAPARDLCGYVVFNYNMLVRNYGGGQLDETKTFRETWGPARPPL